jgi:hypothetical protein
MQYTRNLIHIYRLFKKATSENGVGSNRQARGEHHRHHHHHKHRRRVMAPKTPIRIDPGVGQELERLIDEFDKMCSLGKVSVGGSGTSGSTQVAELIPHIFRLKKTTKKRKGSELNLADEQNTGQYFCSFLFGL